MYILYLYIAMSDIEQNTNTTKDKSSEIDVSQTTLDIQDDLQNLISSSGKSEKTEKIDFSIASQETQQQEKRAQAVENRAIPRKIANIITA
jgi:hypothetical protein